MSDKREKIPVDEAIKRLPTGVRVHTFRSNGMGLIGADWSRSELITAMIQFGVEEAGDGASAMGHTLVLIDDHGPLFIEATRPERPDVKE